MKQFLTCSSITLTAKECDAITREAKRCLVLSTTVLVTAPKSRAAEVHRAVLTVLAEAFDKGIFSEFTNLALASFLGPNPETFHVTRVQTNASSSDEGLTIASLFSLVAVLGAAMLVFAVTITRRTSYSAVATNNNYSGDNLAVGRDTACDEVVSPHARPPQ